MPVVAELFGFSVSTLLVGGIAVGVVALFALILAQPHRPRAHVTGLHIYPIKSCRGVKVSEAVLGPMGFVGDRQYMVVREDGNFVTQRQLPRMCLIQPEFLEEGAEGLLLTALVRNAPEPIEVPLVEEGDGEMMECRIWGKSVLGVDQGDKVAAWLSNTLDEQLRLVHFAESGKRLVPKELRLAKYLSPNLVGFPDVTPFLMIGEETLAELNRKIRQNWDEDGVPEKLPMDRFRPNIVIRGQPARAEDGWRELTIGNWPFYGVKRCTRCKLTTTNQQTAVQGGPEADPLKTLRTYRGVGRNGVVFGLQMTHRWRKGNKRVVIREGDDVIAQLLTPIGPAPAPGMM